MKRFLESNPHFPRAILVLVWFLFLAAINRYSEIPIRSIFPFLLPVAMIAWSYGMGICLRGIGHLGGQARGLHAKP